MNSVNQKSSEENTLWEKNGAFRDISSLSSFWERVKLLLQSQKYTYILNVNWVYDVIDELTGRIIEADIDLESAQSLCKWNTLQQVSNNFVQNILMLSRFFASKVEEIWGTVPFSALDIEKYVSCIWDIHSLNITETLKTKIITLNEHLETASHIDLSNSKGTIISWNYSFSYINEFGRRVFIYLSILELKELWYLNDDEK